MNQFIQLFFLSIGLLISIQGFSQGDADPYKGWKTITKDGCEIKYPKGWTYNEEAAPAGVSFFINSILSDGGDMFAENINMLSQDLSAFPMTLEEYAELSAKQLPMIMEGGVVTENIILEKDGIEFGKMIYQANMQGIDLKFLAYFWMINNQAYVLTLTCEESEYDNYVEEGTKIMESFKILKKEEKTPAKDLFIEEFNWNITIPEGMETFGKEEWEKLKNRGADAIEKETEIEVEDKTKQLFAYNAGVGHNFEANWQSFDESIDGDYKEVSRMTQDLIYQTFENQIPNNSIDSTITTQMVAGVPFEKIDITIELENGVQMKAFMFNTLIDKKDLTISIIYINEKVGQQMMDAFLNSSFGEE